MKSTLTAIIRLSIATALPLVSAVGSGNQPRHVEYVSGKRTYESSAVIQIFVPRKDVVPDPILEGEADNQRRLEAVQRFFADQRKALVADQSVRAAVRDLMPDFRGDHQAATEFMRAELEVEQIKGTDLLKVIVRSGDKRFSRDLANRLAENYLKARKGKDDVQEPILHQKAEEGIRVAKENQEP